MLKALGLTLTFISVAFAGCLGDDESPSRSRAWTPCEDPWPCDDGSHWPENLDGPFEVGELERISIPMSDGAMMEGLLRRPIVEAETGLPVVLVMTPYLDGWHSSSAVELTDENEVETGTDRASILDNEYDMPQQALLEAGYAVAFVAQRGTWYSEGCYTDFSDRAQADAVEVVQWFADAAWSNGRVGMMGVSLPTTSTWQAVAGEAPGLKAIATGGNIHDPWLWGITPQGASWEPLLTPLAMTYYGTMFNTGIAYLNAHISERTLTGQIHPCPSAYTNVGFDWMMADREALAAKTTLPDLYDSTAAVLMLQGSRDGLLWSDEGLWDDYAGPKSQFVGGWGHELPNSDFLADWPAPVIGWFDFWLKGGATPDFLDEARVVTDAGRVLESPTWPPQIAGEVVHLGDGISLEPQVWRETLISPVGPSSGAFQASALVDDEPVPYSSPCHPADGTVLSFISEPLNEAATLAGPGIAYINLEATTGDGLGVIRAWRAPSDATCDGGTPIGYTLLTVGAFDLAYMNGRSVPERHLPGTELAFRVDLNSMHHELAPGDRLLVTISAGEPGDLWGHEGSIGQALTFVGDGTEAGTHIVLPVFEGTLGASAPRLDYEPRPFSRAWFDEQSAPT